MNWLVNWREKLKERLFRRELSKGQERLLERMSVDWREKLHEHVAALNEMCQKIITNPMVRPADDMRRSHPCAFCFTNHTWCGQPCKDCETRLNLWCPCATKVSYTDKVMTPIPGDICCEQCMRCGYRIKVIWDAMDRPDDVLLEKLLDEMTDKDDDESPC